MAVLNGVSSLLWLSLVMVVVLYSQCCIAGDGRYITNESYIYRLRYPNNSVCLTLSLNAEFVFWYEKYNDSVNGTDVTIESQDLTLPNSSRTTMTGDCGLTERTMILSWNADKDDEYSVSFTFSVNTSRWYLSQVRFQVYVGNTSDSELSEDSGILTYATSSGVQTYFNRTFHRQQYFHCKSCKHLWLLEGNDSSACYTTVKKKNNVSLCSYLAISNSVIYPGDLDSNTTSIGKKLCIEDYIELQEIIVPAVVGGILGILLIVIFGSYLIAFIRRKQKEGRYETIGNGGF